MSPEKPFPSARLWARLCLGLLLGPLCLPLSTGCRGRESHAAPKSADVLAQIDDVTISINEFQERINSQTPYVRARYTSLEHKKEFLENLVRFEILAQEARRKGFDRDPEVVRTVKQAMIQKLLKQEFDRLRIEDISEADVKGYFDGHPDEFNKPAEVRTSLILVKDEDTAKKVLGDARSKGLENAGFRELVAQYSLDQETKERGGDLRYFDEKNTELPRELVTAAFKLQNIGDVSPPIKTQKGVAVLKLTGQRKALVRSLDEVRQQIRSKLFRERRQKLMDDYEKALRQKSRVEVHEERLPQVKVDSSGGPPNLTSPAAGTFHPPGQDAPQASPATPGKP